MGGKLYESTDAGSGTMQDGKAKAMGWMASLMFVQFVTRMFHFALNALIMRYLSPESYGIVALQLPFVSSAVTRLIKEALHRSAVRETSTDASNLVLVWLSIPLGMITSGALGYFFITNTDLLEENSWVFVAFGCWLLSAWAEIIVEPVIIFIESHMIMNVIVIVECVSLLVQCVATIVMLYTLDESSIVLVQSYGQLLYSVGLVAGYYGYALIWNPSVARNFWPKSFKITNEMIKATVPFIIQSASKWVTSEGEHAILFFFGTAEQQGIYEFVHNLGSIVARVAFLSIETTGFVVFARLAKPEKKAEKEGVWSMLLNISLTISLLYLATCPCYIYFLVEVVYGQVWRESGAATLLAAYGIYLLLIGVNGLVEAHRDAVSPYDRIQEQTPFMIFVIVSYFGVGSACMHFFGAAGLVFASVVSVLMRLAFNVSFFSDHMPPLSKGIPSLDMWVLFALLFVFGSLSRFYFGDSWQHFGAGAAQAVGAVGWLAFFQREQLIHTWRLMKSKDKSE